MPTLISAWQVDERGKSQASQQMQAKQRAPQILPGLELKKWIHRLNIDSRLGIRYD